jgi:hypothetical protein
VELATLATFACSIVVIAASVSDEAIQLRGWIAALRSQ